MKKNIFGLTLYQTLFFIIVLFLSFVQAFSPLSDPDMFWHIETGNFILNNHYIPTTDVFSYYGIENNLPWIAHEWLSDVFFATLYRLGGYRLLQFFPSIMLCILFCYLGCKTKKIGEDSFEKYVWFFISFLMISALSEVRAHMFSWLFTAITINVLIDFCSGKKNKLFILPLISCLWVNMHGGSSSLLFVLIVFFLVSYSFNFKFGKVYSKKLETKKLLYLLVVLILSITTALINPNTYKILLYPFANMGDKLMLSVIVEWHSPDFHTFDGFIIFILLACICAILITTTKEIKLIDFLLLGAFMYLSLKSIRQVVYLAVIAIPLISAYIPPILKVDNKRNFTYSIICCFLSLLVCFSVFTKIEKPVIDKTIYPTDIAMEKIEDIHPKRMLNNYNWGGYIIKNLNQKEILPFIDGRADIYSKYTLSDFTKLMYLSNAWEKILDKYDFDCIFMDTDNQFTREVSKLDNWHIVYQDNSATILLRKDKENVEK